MDICIIGKRGHLNTVIDPLAEQSRQHRIVGMSPGGVDDDIEPVVERLQEQGHPTESFTDGIAMLEQCQPTVLAINGPFERHVDWALAAFERGISVYCEKPAADTIPQLDRLEQAYREAAGKASLHFATMMGSRSSAHWQRAHQLVRKGAVGEVRLLHAQKSYKLGQRAPYFHKRATCTGMIPWVGAHAIDWVHWLSGKQFVDVAARHSRRCNREHDELEASAGMLFGMSDEVIATVTCDYLRPQSSNSHGDDRIRVTGSQGVLEVRGGQVFLNNAEFKEGEPQALDQPGGDLFLQFLAQVDGGDACPIAADDVFAVTRACLLARDAADRGEILRFERASAGV